MKVLLLLSALLLLCGCATLADLIDSKFPDGESCLTLETPRKTVRICISKETIAKPDGLEELPAPFSECLDPLYLNLQEEVSPVPVIEDTSSLERLIGNLGFPIVICLVLIYMQWKFLGQLRELSLDISAKLDRVISMLAREG